MYWEVHTLNTIVNVLGGAHRQFNSYGIYPSNTKIICLTLVAIARQNVCVALISLLEQSNELGDASLQYDSLLYE